MKSGPRLLFQAIFVAIFTLAGCSAPAAPPIQPTNPPISAPTTAPATSPTPAATDTSAAPTAPSATSEPSPTPGPTLPPFTGTMFLDATHCNRCHTGLTDSGGADISFDKAWAPSMHANAARDPYFQATVRSEVEQHQDLRDVIETTCSTCHLPMARTAALAAKKPVQMLDTGFLDVNNELHQLGIDGISCTFCHQVQNKGLGTAASFSGGYQIDTTVDMGERLLFGPFPIADADLQLKKVATGFVATQSDHLTKPEFCAICHTLHTPEMDSTGKILGAAFPEQMQYLEWQNSSFNGTIMCQACHMPPVNGEAMIANVGGSPRSPVHVHTFVGGNSYMINLMAANGQALQVSATPEDLKAASQRNLDFLQKQTASLDASAAKDGDALKIQVKVGSLVGHKFPSGFPSRRAWLHLSVADASGKVIFASGQYSQDGKIVENDNDQDASKYEPHFDVITDPKQVQIYETILGNSDGAVTTELIRSVAYLKDNRLLPSGFDKTKAVADIGVAGEALRDDNFTGGNDLVTYQVDAKGQQGPFKVTVELLFQPIGYRWAQNITVEKSAEAQAFQSYIQLTPLTPVKVTEATADIN